MSPQLPDGQDWPVDGHLDPALSEVHRDRPLSLYVHVPFCRVRCGYCDFNTYTVGFGPGAEPESYGLTVLAEAHLARRSLDQAGFPDREVQTIFFGGGTPTLLGGAALVDILTGLGECFPIAPSAEITVEANPETIDPPMLQALAEAGVTRVSVGMQSAVPSVLATLDRSHRPEMVPQVVQWARQVGIDVSVDLIYGTPGESIDNWRTSLDAAISYHPHHVSAYALVIEEGTKMGAQVARGTLPTPDPDDEAEKYEIADAKLSEAGYYWYETSNFAKAEPGEERLCATELRHASRHNMAYWRDWDWWGLGPGAHSHVGSQRWWNVKHPRAYASRLHAGASPAMAGEILDPQSRELERILLGVRMAEGVQLEPGDAWGAVDGLVADGLVLPEPARRGRIVLTLRGRLLADYVTRELTDF